VQPAPVRPLAVITAAADVPGVPVGGVITSTEELAAAFIGRARHLGDKSGPVQVAGITRQFGESLPINASFKDMRAAFRRAASPAALTASGGWCAPSEIRYELCNLMCTDDGLWSGPTVGITRGGLQVPSAPSFADIASQIWTWTETNDIASLTGSPTKPCFQVDCPDFTDYRLQATGFCLTAGNLTNQAYPELVENQIELMLGAMEHIQSMRYIQAIIAASTPVVHVPDVAEGLTASVINGAELQAWIIRDQYGMCSEDPIEVVLPRWVRGAIRSDLCKRNGVGVDYFDTLTNEQIDTYFTVRNLRPQWVADFPAPYGQLATTGIQWPESPTYYPYIVYPAGQFVLGLGETINLGAIRDSTLNATNDYTAMWIEQPWLLAEVCAPGASRYVTTDACPGGFTAGQAISCETF
jgi:hypothetical protein